MGTELNTLSDVQSLSSISLCHFYTFVVVIVVVVVVVLVLVVVIIMDVLGG